MYETPPACLTLSGAIMALTTTSGKIARTAIELAVEDVNRNTSILNGTLLNIHIRDSRQDSLTGVSAALELLRKGCVSIIGPQMSVVAEFVAHLGVAARVPVVTFAATNPSLSMHRYPYFIRMAPSDTPQMTAIAKLIDNYSWRDVVLVYVDDDMGTGSIPALDDALRAEGKVVYKAAVPPQADISTMRRFVEENLMRQESRVFIVHMPPESALTLFSEANKLRIISSEYVWIVTDAIASLLDSFNTTSLQLMNGVLGVKRSLPKTNQPRLNEFAKRWKQRFRAQNPEIPNLELNDRGLAAYDTVWAITFAIDHLLRGGLFDGDFSAASNKTKILNFRVFEGGEQLLKQILDTNFIGLSGPVRVSPKSGEILEFPYDIINMVGNSYKVIGSWTEAKGLQISSKQVVHWGRGSTKTPRGWAITAPGKIHRIGVPWDRGFTQFISVKPVHASAGARNQSYEITGFCIDVFKAVLKRLDYALPYELIPYGSGNVTADYYDDLVYQVHLQKFDAVVGDITVNSNRSKYVDFTQPYTETGLVMVVAIADEGSSEPWAFLRPFTPAMWITTVAFFIFTGAVVWLLEHRRNRQFRGTPRKQVLTFIWFSFSTLFTTQTEKIVSSLGRAVVIIWLFVVLVLVSSYTASLSSMLTVRQIVPKIESIDTLITQNLPIGYRQGTFIANYLEHQLYVNKSLLRPYTSVQEYAIALEEGTNNGGAGAIFDEETVAQNLFLSTRCNAFSKVGPTYRTGGYGFVFPKGSPLVSDISKAILNLSESTDMRQIRKRWFNSSESKCDAESGAVESTRLSFDNFWVLFLLTGGVSFLTLLYYLCRLLYRFVYRYENSCPHDKSISTRLRTFVSFADQKDIPPPKRKRCETVVWSYGTNGGSDDRRV
ncbi:glutamate receptor 3.6 isoform X2 [Cryptomeria japonica]|uniref:glutamate receptor 3.6 isoform X2 n=1 Tax=Cryptomeria japonica TaxID=3369 RepID=UPI0025AB862A|nr:glutamate receptor 3.6 isoform X2 [Cryptomeria japonica]